jgi:hypothetical protein
MSINFVKKAAASVAAAVAIVGFAAPATFAMGSDSYGGGGGNSNFTTTSFNSSFNLSLQISQSTSFSTTSFSRNNPMMKHHHNYGNWGGYDGNNDGDCNRGYESSYD